MSTAFYLLARLPDGTLIPVEETLFRENEGRIRKSGDIALVEQAFAAPHTPVMRDEYGRDYTGDETLRLLADAAQFYPLPT